MDVKTFFLNGEMEEKVYIEKAEGFVAHNIEIHVSSLKIALYRFKQVARVCYECIDICLHGMDL